MAFNVTSMSSSSGTSSVLVPRSATSFTVPVWPSVRVFTGVAFLSTTIVMPFDAISTDGSLCWSTTVNSRGGSIANSPLFFFPLSAAYVTVRVIMSSFLSTSFSSEMRVTFVDTLL